ncbi:helix-turn-helix domain-containing protein [Streptomyces virginiae]
MGETTLPNGPRVLEDGSATVPPGLAATTFYALWRHLEDQIRTNGGALTPEARALLRALHESAQSPALRPATSSEGSVIGDGGTLGASEVARALGCSRRWASYLLGSGRLRAWRVGRTWVTTQRDLDRYRFGEEPPHAKPAGEPAA